MEKNSYYWVYTTTVFTDSLTEDSPSLPKVGIIITFYTWATEGLERLEPAPAVTQLGSVKSQLWSKSSASRATAVRL